MKRHEWAAFLRDMRGTLDYIRADLPLDRVQFVDKAGNDVPPPLREDVPPALIATIISHTSAIAEAPPELVSLTRRIWCLVCLENVDSALLAQLYEDAGDALGSFSDAAEALRNARGPEKRATSMALKGAMAKLAADPKQAEKRAVRECWELWRQEPARYDGKAAFARDMLQKFESLTSQVTIERWCRLWEMSEQTSSVEPKK